MNTRTIASEYRLAHWTQIIRERSESGLSIKAFCENAGIHENTYFYWQKKLRETACKQFAMVNAKPAPNSLVSTGFTEVKLCAPSSSESNPETVLSGHLSIELSGIKITTDAAYPTDKLAYLLRKLVKPC